MAQVVREPFSGKPPTVSTYFSLPGRYLVLMPGVDTSGVSRKIDNEEHRERLRKIVNELQPPEGFGLIVRTAGLGQTKAELQRDLRYLLRLWQSIQRASKANEFPGIVYQEADLVIRTMRDHLSADIDEVWIDSQETYDKTDEFVRSVMPTRAKVLRLYTGNRPLFNKYNLEEQIESIYKRRVSLPSGGEIVIDGTEALTAIDVNSARSKRKGDAEETILTTNLEAAAEIARQLRLRDLAGLIVVDFIDMSPAKNRKKVEDAMREAMRGDRAKHDITRLSKLGLMEIARQRLRGAKMGAMYAACPTCEGYGMIKNLEAAGLAAVRKLQTRATRTDVGRIRIGLPVDVATWVLNNKRDELVEIERRQNLRIDIGPMGSLLRHEVEFEAFPREKTDPPAPVPTPTPAAIPDAVAEPATPVEPPVEPTAVVAAEPNEPSTPTAEPSAPPTGEEPAPRKRRRRRRSASSANRAPRGEQQTDGSPPAVATDDGAAPSDTRPTGDETSPGTPRANGAPPVAIEAIEAIETIEAKAASEANGETLAVAAERKDTAETDGERPRRRKRRRRRRGGDSGGGASGGSEAPVAAETPVVPQGVRSDELMPAAVGGRRRGGGGRSTNPARRRPKGGGEE
jgi:ribonuclease E